jgi:quinol monooxygenase YgiN
MRKASEVWKEKRQKSEATTGNNDLDSLIGGIYQGQFYLFYSTRQDILDALIHRLLVNVVLPTKKGGFSSKAFYVNICNYHRGKTVFNPSKLGTIAKHTGIDPHVILQNVYCISAFNEMQQTTAIKKIVTAVKNDNDVKVIIVHNLTRFIETSTKPVKALQALKQNIRALKNSVAEREIALIVSCNALRTNRKRIPRPIGGTYLRHEADIVVLLDNIKQRNASIVKTTLIKHPSKRTPQSRVFHVSNRRVTRSGNDHASLNVQQQFQRLIKELRRSEGFQDALITTEHKKAFELLLNEAWSIERAIASYPKKSHPMDIMNLMANVNNKKQSEELKKKLQQIERMFVKNSLENKVAKTWR